MLFILLGFSITVNAQTFIDSVRSGKISMEMYTKAFNDLDPSDATITGFKDNGKWGFKDSNGKMIIKPKYDKESDFQHGVAIVRLNGKEGLINVNDNVIIAFGTYDDIYDFKGNRARVRKNKRYGIIDQNGKEILPCAYISADNYRFQLCELTDKNNKEGIVDLNGKVVVPFIYDKLVQMQIEGVIKAKRDGKWGYLNYNGEDVIRFEYDYIEQPVRGMIAVKKNKKFGFINTLGEEIVPCVYDTVYTFNENGKASVIKNGKPGYVLKDGTEKIYK